MNTTFYQLPTNRKFSDIFIRGCCTLTISLFVDMYAMQRDLNTIAKAHTNKRASFLFWSGTGRKTFKLLNSELERRGINFRVKVGLFPAASLRKCAHSVTALNLLCADYNKRGC